MKRRAIVGGAALVGVFTAITIGGTQVETPESPVADGWPDASNTGVPDGVTLTPYTGPLTITASGVTNIVGKEIGTSTSPVLLILPVRAKIAVPGDRGVPIDANHLAPRRMIRGAVA